DSSGYVGNQPNPTDSRSATTGLYEPTRLVGKQHIGKIYPGPETEGVIAPSTTIDIEQPVLTVSWIEFVLQFGQSVVVNRPQEAVRQLFQQRKLDRLDECASTAEFWRMLAPPSDDHTPDGFSRFEKGAIGELLLAVTGYQVLNHHLPGWYFHGRHLKQLLQFCAVVGTPRLGFRRIEEVFFDRGLDCKGRICPDLL